MGAFAIGAAPLQVFGGRMAEIYGAKWVLFAAGFGTAITNFLIPHIAHYSYYLLIVVRIIMGISQSGMESALMCLFAEWLAPAETSFFISMLLFAICIGGFLGSLCSAYLLTLGLGWPITYYVASGLSFVWSILWLLFATSRPHDHKLLSKQELNYILNKQKRQMRSNDTETNILLSTIDSSILANNNNNNHNSIHNDIEQKRSNELIRTTTPNDSNNFIKTESPMILIEAPISPTKSFTIFNTSTPTTTTSATTSAPWRNILTTPQVWVFIITKISVRWCADVITIELPTYLSNVLHLSIKLNGLLNSISAALFAIFSFISGCVANKLLKTRPGNLSKTNIRKIIQGFASFGGALGLFLMTTNDCNLVVTISMLMFLSCCLVFGTGGELQIPFDMTSEYPGTLHGLACTLSVSGWLAPPLVGLVLGDQPNSRARWSIVWYSTALISLIGGLVFVLFADARPIDFTVNTGNNQDNNINGSDDLNGSKERQKEKVLKQTKQQQVDIIADDVINVSSSNNTDHIETTMASKSTTITDNSLTSTHQPNNVVSLHRQHQNKTMSTAPEDGATNNENSLLVANDTYMTRLFRRFLLCSQYNPMKTDNQLLNTQQHIINNNLVKHVEMSTNSTWSNDYVTITHL